MTKTQKQLQSEQTYQQIINTAAKLFTSKGYHGTSMADLATATGLTKGAFYHHFTNKDDLFFAVVESVQEKWKQAVAQEILHTPNAFDQIAILLDRHAQLLRKEPTLCLVITGLTAELEDDNPDFMAVLHGVYLGMIDFIKEIILRGQANGQIRSDIDAQLTALNIVGLLRGVSCFGILGSLGLNCETVIRAFKPVLLNGLRPPAS